MRAMRAGAPGSAATAYHANQRRDVPDYDPLTISDEELKQLPAAERGAVYKARRAAATGGAPPPTASAPSAAPPAAPPPAAAAPPPPEAVAPAPAAAAPPAAPAPKPAAPKSAPAEPEKPSEPPFVQTVLKNIPESTFQWRHG